MNELKNLKIGCAPYACSIGKIIAKRPKYGLGCQGCVFNDKGAGAEMCDKKTCCMSHHRPDKTSVIFVKTV